jgi:hypothetical protein
MSESQGVNAVSEVERVTSRRAATNNAAFSGSPLAAVHLMSQ